MAEPDLAPTLAPAGSRWMLPLAGLLSAVAMATLAFGPIGFVREYLAADDAFYYLMIARHAVEGGGFTFDGIHPTSGFQPLWQWLMLPGGLLPRDAQLRFATVLGGVLLQSAAWLMLLRPPWRDARGDAWRLAGLILLANQAISIRFAGLGMEFSLYLLAAVVALREAVLLREDTGRAPARLMAAGALVCLCRTDGIGLAALLWAWVGGARGRGWSLRAAAGLGVSALPWLAWCAWSQAHLGTFLPVSGEVKRAAAEAFRTHSGIEAWSVERLLGAAILALRSAGWAAGVTLAGFLPAGGLFLPTWVGALAAGGVMVALGAGARAAGWSSLRPSGAACVLIAFGGVQCAFYAWAFHRDLAATPWYLGPLLAGMALWAGGVLAALPAAQRPTTPMLTVVTMMVAPIIVWTVTSRPRTEAIDAAFAAIEPGTVMAPERVGSWNAGLVAWRAPGGVSVINLDGLVNDVAFARGPARDGGLLEYLRTEEIRHLIEYTRDGDWRREFAWRLRPARAEALPLQPVHVGSTVHSAALPSERTYVTLRVLVEPPSRAPGTESARSR